MNIAWKSLLLTGIVAISFIAPTNNHSANAAPFTGVDGEAVPSTGMKDAGAQHSALIAAAEPFEALTEQAATATSTVLGKLIGEARNAANAVSGSLDQTQRDRLASEIADITAAQKAGDRTAIALAAVEGYRTLIESAANTGMTPRAVSLLDYAGFRYQANLAATPARWSDAAAAVDFADIQWAALSPKITKASLRDQMSNSIADMRKAVKTKDSVLAKSASTKELGLVDKLEAYFEAK